MKKIVFLTGTRADFGKLKSLIEILDRQHAFEVHIFATGMHMDEKFGYTFHEIEKCGYKNITTFVNHDADALMDMTFARTVSGFSEYIRRIQPHLIVVHGDRIEALAGATVGALNNVLVAHIEGGELSGTVDELIRHAVSKLSHTHFVANDVAARRLIQMGERKDSVFVIGSPDMDVMLSEHLPSWENVKAYYDIPFDHFAVSLFHPVTTEFHHMPLYAQEYIQALTESNLNFVAVYPNNDKGSEYIQQALLQLNCHPRFRLFPSMRFESFLTVMKHAVCMVGNSSAGIREAPYFGVPVVNIGSRQHGRTEDPDIIHTGYSRQDILNGIAAALQQKPVPKKLFGEGDSDVKFAEILQSPSFWNTSQQKIFADLPGLSAIRESI